MGFDMAIREIITENTEEKLRKSTREVKEFNERLWLLLEDMKDTMAKADGVGLAAPQVGILKKVVTIDVKGNGDCLELINPEIISFDGEQYGVEGCLSFPGQYGMVRRPQTVRVKAYDRNGKEIFLEGEELLARALCHEIDHLNGKLFIDLVEEKVDV